MAGKIIQILITNFSRW